MVSATELDALKAQLKEIAEDLREVKQAVVKKPPRTSVAQAAAITAFTAFGAVPLFILLGYPTPRLHRELVAVQPSLDTIVQTVVLAALSAAGVAAVTFLASLLNRAVNRDVIAAVAVALGIACYFALQFGTSAGPLLRSWNALALAGTLLLAVRVRLKPPRAAVAAAVAYLAASAWLGAGLAALSTAMVVALMALVIIWLAARRLAIARDSVLAQIANGLLMRSAAEVQGQLKTDPGECWRFPAGSRSGTLTVNNTGSKAFTLTVQFGSRPDHLARVFGRREIVIQGDLRSFSVHPVGRSAVIEGEYRITWSR